MAIILIDSCVTLDLGNPDSDWFEWSASTLERLDSSNTFVINPIVYAECAIGYSSIEDVETFYEPMCTRYVLMPG